MIGRALISANMNGEIGYQDKQTIILYSPKESAKRMSEYRQEKEDAIAQAKEISPLPEETTEDKPEEGEIEKVEVKEEKPLPKTNKKSLLSILGDFKKM